MSTIKGIGFDLVDCDRFRAMAQKRPTLIERLFSPEEIAYANKYSDPTVHLCACFAVKEAYLKALGTGINGQVLKNIEMGHTPEQFLRSFGSISRCPHFAPSAGSGETLESKGHCKVSN